MTALKKYQKLESPGLWRDTPEAQRREVVVNFGEASLVLTDPRTEAALTHWSLPAVERLNPGTLPAVYSPGADATETLEIDDPEMMAALETVRGVLAQTRPRPGRLRGSILLGSVALVVALGVFWLPGALERHTASVLPPSTRAEIGTMALADLARLTGRPCTDAAGQEALDLLGQRLFGAAAPRLVILRDGGAQALALPGPILALNAKLVETADGPEVAAGFALAETARAAALDPMIALLHHAGLGATFRLLTTGVLPQTALRGYGEVLLRQTPVAVDDATLLASFASAQVSSTAYAYALDASGESVLGLIEADPSRNRARPLLADGDWISLQAICAE
ncbi:hypothetical protein [Rhodobacter ferrooxidans]|uniref:Uncharacterized protein n=1 Tax=Rhodobacter ferrooxidans TaxID=371731 RepID=C8S3E5_9RHOB|nr:hypothetical protein [Rhodobacter sp. SW2]EEW24510.1 conserved hypothetical protein [Rhodobacter sp. SW2]